jgi:HK97 family phage major capsid protein
LSAQKKEDPTQNQRKQVVTTTPKQDELDKEIRKYSLVNVIRGLAGDRVDVGREREISDELAKQRGKAATGIIVPHAALAQRAFTVSGTSSASVSTDLLGSEFIDLLRTRSILGALGCRFLPGLVGSVAIPKMSAGATGYWVTEAAAITGSEPTLGQVTGTPHTCGVLVDISRKLINQSTPAAEMIARDEMLERIARTIQIAVFAGTGADGQPSAITNATGINNPSVTQGTPTYAELLGFPGAIFADNAEGSVMRWAMTAEVWAKLAATATNGAGSQLALDPVSRRLIGYEYATSEDLPANSLWFGDWSTVNIGVWGAGVDVNVDDKTLSSSGGLRLVALQDVDVMVRLGEKLAYNTDVTV